MNALQNTVFSFFFLTHSCREKGRVGLDMDGLVLILVVIGKGMMIHHRLGNERRRKESRSIFRGLISLSPMMMNEEDTSSFCCYWKNEAPGVRQVKRRWENTPRRIRLPCICCQGNKRTADVRALLLILSEKNPWNSRCFCGYRCEQSHWFLRMRPGY